MPRVDSDKLPAGVFAGALDLRLRVEEARIRSCFNRARAVFAEALVAQLLPGAAIVENPSAAWDVSWTPGRGSKIRIQVKCSGGYLPRFPDRAKETPASWAFPPPKAGFDETFASLPAGHHCD